MPTATLSLFRFQGTLPRLWVLGQMALARLALRREPHLMFWKLCGSGTGEGFTPKPNWGVWAIVAAWPDDAPLSREQRIGAQRALTALGFDTRGIDGVVGANTRAALRRWQTVEGRTPDGYLSATLADELITLVP